MLWGHFIYIDEDPEEKVNILLGASVLLSPLVIVILLVSFGEGVKNYFTERPQQIPAEQSSGGSPS